MARVSGDDDSCVPAWSGFNALVSNNSIPAAETRYLPFSNTSPSYLHNSAETGGNSARVGATPHTCHCGSSNIEQGSGTTDPLE